MRNKRISKSFQLVTIITFFVLLLLILNTLMIQLPELIAWQNSKLSTQICKKMFHNFFILIKLIWQLIKRLHFFKAIKSCQKAKRNKIAKCFFFVYKTKCSFTGSNIISQGDRMTSQFLEYPSITREEMSVFS